MVSPPQKRRAAEHLVKHMELSERKACDLVGLRRSVHRSPPQSGERDRTLKSRLRELSRQYPRYGYRRIYGVLKEQGYRVNHKKIQRLWREEGLKVPVKQRRKRRTGTSTGGRHRAQYVNHVWSWDIVFDSTEDRRQFKILTMVDEYCKVNLALHAGRHISAADVVDSLEQAMSEYGTPANIRSDNGSEFIAGNVQQHLADRNIEINYIDPGSPWETPYIESFNSRLRDECLNRELFGSMLEVQTVLNEFQHQYNCIHPHSALGFKSPMKYLQELFTISGPAGPEMAGSPAGTTGSTRSSGVA